MRPHAIHPPADSREVSLTDDLFVPNAWREPMHRVLAGACERRSAMLLVSAEGRGQSTFLACLGPAASVLDVPTEVFIVEARQSTDWLAAAAAAFDLATTGLGRRDGLIAALRAGLSQRTAGGAQLIIAFDDADTLPRPALAEIMAFIAGWPSGQAPALILLTGTSDLAEQIAEVAPLREMQHWPRVSLAPWDLEDLTAYVRHRLARQRGGGHRFSPEALVRVHELSAGEPVTVSRMVMTALSFARGTSETTISHTAIEYVVTALYTDAPDADADASMPRHDLRQRAGGGTKREGIALVPPLGAPEPPAYSMARSGLADSADVVPFSSRLLPNEALPSEALPGEAFAGRPPLLRAVSAEGDTDAFPPLGAAPGRPSAPRPRQLWFALAAMAGLVLVGGVMVYGWRGGETEKGGIGVALPVTSSSPLAAPVSTLAPGPAEEAAAPLDRSAAQLSWGSPTGGAVGFGAEGVKTSGAAGSTADGAGGTNSGSSTQDTAVLIGRGDALMLLSDVSAARQFYLLAARSGDPMALTAVAGTYDPLFLQETGVRGARGDARQAISLYRDAIRRGASLARTRLAALVAYMVATKEIGADEANQLLNSDS